MTAMVALSLPLPGLPPGGLAPCLGTAVPRLVARRRPGILRGMLTASEEQAARFAALVARIAQHQDRQAFVALFDHFAPRVKAYLMRLGADDGPAEELAQEVLLAIWRRAASFNPALARVRTW